MFPKPDRCGRKSSNGMRRYSPGHPLSALQPHYRLQTRMCPDAKAGSVGAALSVDPAEVEKFSKLAAEWWDANGAFAPLHKFNPVRLQFIRDMAADHFGRDRHSLRPFERLS